MRWTNSTDKVGNPGVQDGATPGLKIGPGTEIIAGENKILTAGGVDAHIHFISPQQTWEALYSGVTPLPFERLLL